MAETSQSAMEPYVAIAAVGLALYAWTAVFKEALVVKVPGGDDGGDGGDDGGGDDGGGGGGKGGGGTACAGAAAAGTEKILRALTPSAEAEWLTPIAGQWDLCVETCDVFQVSAQ